MYKLLQFWGLAEQRQQKPDNKKQNVQGISGFGRFFVVEAAAPPGAHALAATGHRE